MLYKMFVLFFNKNMFNKSVQLYFRQSESILKVFINDNDSKCIIVLPGSILYLDKIYA